MYIHEIRLRLYDVDVHYSGALHNTRGVGLASLSLGGQNSGGRRPRWPDAPRICLHTYSAVGEVRRKIQCTVPGAVR